MEKIVTILFLLFIVLSTHAASDSTTTSVKSSTILQIKKGQGDSTNVLPNDSVVVKINNDKTLSKPDSVQKFVDKNGDGFNDNAPDHDCDGIPDALDKDYWALKENKLKPEEIIPAKVFGLDNKTVKIKSKNKSEPGRAKPGIKFKKPQRRNQSQRGKR